MDEIHPQTALLRMLAVISDPVDTNSVFPGEASFDPIAESKKPPVKAIIARGVNLTTRDTSGDTALHVATKEEDCDQTFECRVRRGCGRSMGCYTGMRIRILGIMRGS